MALEVLDPERSTLSVPLARWDDGSIRVGGTRVLLDTVVTAFNLGDSAEEIADNHGKMPLDVIYATIAFYLAHRSEVDLYVAKRQAEAEVILAAIETAHPTGELRRRLLERIATRRASTSD